jgi:SPP1 gp7 family putative phage head morphogenesis protein
MATDPRRGAGPDGPAEALRDASIAHLIRILRLGGGEAAIVTETLERDVYPAVRQEAERAAVAAAAGSASGRAARTASIVQGVGSVLSAGMLTVRTASEGRLGDLAELEGRWQAAALRRALPIGVDFRSPSPALLREAVRYPIDGNLLGEWYSGIAAKTRNEVQRQITIGLGSGESIPRINARIRSALDTTTREADAIARTSVNAVSNSARHRTYEEHPEIITGYQWVSTLDARTTPICQHRDGRVYPLNDGPLPPAHIRCRSTTTPVLAPWEDWGVDASSIPEATRASANGQVPASLTYGEWLRRQPAAVQNEVLGNARARLFRQGRVSFDRFADDTGRRYTLAQLAAREGLD